MNDIIDEITKCLDQNKILVNYVKVQGHSGEMGNERADKRAKKALKKAMAFYEYA